MRREGVNYLGRKMKDSSLRWINIGGAKEVDIKAGDRKCRLSCEDEAGTGVTKIMGASLFDRIKHHKDSSVATR
jgi:hypothetical protein